MAKQPQVYVVSDSLGETAESVAKATIGQYDTDIEIHRVPFIRHTDQIEKIIDEAYQLRNKTVRLLGDDILIEGEL